MKLLVKKLDFQGLWEMVYFSFETKQLNTKSIFKFTNTLTYCAILFG